MARKMSASAMGERIQELAEVIQRQAADETRRDIADAFLTLIKDQGPEGFRSYIRGSKEVSERTGTVTEYKSYLPEVDADTYEITEDFVKGVRLVCAALRDTELFDF
jgi:hypothetical protein